MSKITLYVCMSCQLRCHKIKNSTDVRFYLKEIVYLGGEVTTGDPQSWTI